MSFLLSQPGKSACHFTFDCSSKSGGVWRRWWCVWGGFLCTTTACCQHATYIVVAGCHRNEIPHLELKVINCQGNHLHQRKHPKKNLNVRVYDIRFNPMKNEAKLCNSEVVGEHSWSPMNISVIRSAGVSMPTIWGYTRPRVLLREAIPPDCGKSNHIQTAPIRKTMAEAIATAIMSPELFCRH